MDIFRKEYAHLYEMQMFSDIVRRKIKDFIWRCIGDK